MENQSPNDNSDTELMKKMEDEHCRLQRQVRMIQTDRLQRSMGVHPQFRREDQLLRTLKNEYVDLLMDLKIARSGAHKKKRQRLETNLNTALLLRDQTEVECEEGVIMMEKLEGVLQGNNKDMLRLKKLVNASKGQMQQRQVESERRLVATKNKLETAMLRFNAVQTENKKIRNEIEHMLTDRSLFNQSWTKIMTALGKGKKFLLDLFESSTLAYDQRDEWCAKLRSLQEKGRMDQAQQVQEMRDMQKHYDHEVKTFHFLAKKGVVRVNMKEERREEEERKVIQETVRRDYDEHVKILDEINDYTQEANVEKIIQHFEMVEQQNFSTYRLLTEYCAANEVLAKALEITGRDVADRKDWNEMKEANRQNKLEKLRRDLEDKKKNTEELRRQLEDKEELLNGTMEKVGDMFKMLDCSLEPFQNLLGNKEPSLHQLNLMLCLITDKIKEHVETVYYYERVIQKKGDKTTSRLKKYTIHPEPHCHWKARPITSIVPADPCPSLVQFLFTTYKTKVELQLP